MVPSVLSLSRSVEELIEVIRIESTADIPAIAHEPLAGIPELICTSFERGVFVRELCVQRLVQIHLGTDTGKEGQKAVITIDMQNS
jgi:hypothetical protein